MSELNGDVRRILVRSVNWVGDAILTLPALGALARRFPAAEIAVLAVPWVADLFAGQPGIGRVLTLARGGLGQRWRDARALAGDGFDLAIVFPNSFDAALGPRLAGIPRRIGYATDARRCLLTHAIAAPRGAPRHQVHRYLDLVGALGATAPPVPRLAVPAAAQQAAERLLARHGIGAGDALVAVNPGSVYGGAKRWPAGRYAAVADDLAARGARIALVGSRGEAAVLGEVGTAMRAPAAVLAGETDLPTLAAVLQRARLLLTNDTGAMHVAGAVGTPVVAIFGPTDPATTGPLGPRAALVRHPVACSPCLYRECPIDHRCMTGLGVGRVLAAAVTAMGESEVPGPSSEVTIGESDLRGPRSQVGAGPRRPTPGPRPAAFLDRDGTIMEDLGYLGDPEQIRLIPGAIEGLGQLQAAGYRLVLVTNQSGVARGLISEAQVQRVNERLMGLLRDAGIRIDGVYYCPHHPEHGPSEYRLACECRKPMPGMVRRAAGELRIDLRRSVVIGDHATDTQMARSFPGMRAILVRTGHGVGQAERIERGEAERPDHVAADLGAAARWLLEHTEGSRVGAGRPA